MHEFVNGLRQYMDESDGDFKMRVEERLAEIEQRLERLESGTVKAADAAEEFSEAVGEMADKIKASTIKEHGK